MNDEMFVEFCEWVVAFESKNLQDEQMVRYATLAAKKFIEEKFEELS